MGGPCCREVYSIKMIKNSEIIVSPFRNPVWAIGQRGRRPKFPALGTIAWNGGRSAAMPSPRGQLCNTVRTPIHPTGIHNWGTVFCMIAMVLQLFSLTFALLGACLLIVWACLRDDWGLAGRCLD